MVLVNAPRHLDRSIRDRRGHTLAPTACVAFGTALAVVLVGLASPVTAAPGDPTAGNPVPAPGATGVAVAPGLSVDVTAAGAADVDVTFHGRTAGGDTEPFSIVVMPDTQNYTANDTALATMQQQVSWILDQREARNIQAVVHTGDIQNNVTTGEWARATTALAPLRRADLALAVTLGNHDYDSIRGDTSRSYAAASSFDAAFPVAPAEGSLQQFGWAGGYLGDPNDAVTVDQDEDLTDRGWKDSYVLVSAGGVDLVIISVEFNIPDEALMWVEGVLAQYPDRLAVLNTHQWLEDDASSSMSTSGATAAWNTLRDNCNLRLIVSGHNHSSGGEAYRQETNTCGDPVQMHMADYQSRTNNGNGWLRLLTFDPEADTFTVQTYSPLLDQWETDADSAFTHALTMSSTEPGEWQTLGTTTVAGGTGTASITWPGLSTATAYEWYVDLDDGTTQSSTSDTPWAFTTRTGPPATPAGLTLEADGATSATATWHAATYATSYELAIDGDTAHPQSSATTSATLTGLTTGQETCIQVRAVNGDGVSAWSDEACATPTAQPDWVAYIDTYGTSSDGTHPNALRWTSLPSSTTTLKDVVDGEAIDGVGVQVATSGTVRGYSNGADAAATTDAAQEFDGFVDLAGSYNMTTSSSSMTMTFTGLDPGRTYTLVATSNRDDPDYDERTSTFALQSADAFTNASSAGTTAIGDGSRVRFSTGNNTANGFVARWTGIQPGADGSIVLGAEFGNSDGTAYGPGAVKLALESDPTAPPSTPANLVAGSASDTSVALSWAAVGSATSYELAIDGDTADPITESGTSHTLTGLTTGVEVCAQVRARNANGVSAWSPASCATPGLWTAYIDTNSSGGSSPAGAVSLSSSQVTSGSTVGLKDFATGSPLAGIQMVTASSGLTASSSGGHGVTPTGGDALAVFGGKVNVAGTYRMTSSSTMTSTFTGLDPTRTYELVTTANRDDADYTARTSTFALEDADAFVNASSTGTGAAPTDAATTFVTGDNTTNGYVARWTGISPGADGVLRLATQFGTSSGTAYGAAAIMLRLEPPAVVPDTTPPVITLTGPAAVTLTVGDAWTDPGATAVDDRDGDLTAAIVTTGTVDPAAAGDYTLSYDVSDAAGNAATTVTRTVTVEPLPPDTTPPVITLTGPATFTVSVGDAWTDPGATATDDRDGDLTAAIVTTGTVDLTTAGDYTLSYDVSDAAGNHATTVTRTVTVEDVIPDDTTPPVITLTGPATVTLTVGDAWTDPGATAVDDRDGNLTAAIVTTGTVDPDTVGDYTLSYDVSDAAGNAATTVTRTVTVEPVPADTTPPVITRTGPATVTLTVGDAWTDPGATATDDRDGNLTAAIVTTGTVNLTRAGTYTLRYDVTDAAGNHATTVTRAVTVKAIVIPPGAVTVELASAIVHALYADLLGRRPDPTGLATWTRALLDGVSQAEVAQRIMYSDEYVVRRIRLAYADVLDRGPDTAGAQSWFAAARAGLIGLDDVQRAFLLSSEYYARAGGTPATFVAALYTTVLHRTAGPAEIQGWLRVYDAHGRATVVDGIWFSPEARRGRVGAYYQGFLGRTGDAGGLATWVEVGRSRGEHQVRMGILGSTEYRNRSLLRFI